VTDLVHEATVELADGADPRALGGAITVAMAAIGSTNPLATGDTVLRSFLSWASSLTAMDSMT
jgi:hypothetical protein